MSHKKAGGSTSLGRDSAPKYLGVKLFGGQKTKVGSIIIRQKGTKFRPGQNVKIGKDNTIFAVKEGYVFFAAKKIKKFDGNSKIVKIVNVK